MSKRLPVSQATNEHRALLARIGASERAIADAGADLASASTVGRIMSTMPRGLEAFGSELHGFDDDPFPVEYVWMARWAACKHVYRIDPTVADELARQPLEGALPAEAIRHLPYPIVYVDAPVDFSAGAASGARPRAGGRFPCYLDHAPEAPESDCLALVYMHNERPRQQEVAEREDAECRCLTNGKTRTCSSKTFTLISPGRGAWRCATPCRP